MSEESKTNQVEETNATNPSTDASKNNDIPYSRFQEVNTQKKELQDQVAKMQEQLNTIDAENKVKREERMKKNEDYTTLIAEKDAEIEKLSGFKTQWNDYETSRRDALQSKLPENKQKFVSSMSLQDLEEFVDIESTNLNKGTGMDSSRVGAKAQDSGEFGGYSSMQEFAMRDPKGCETYLENNTKGYIK
tara:strand:- start:276 stop:845 length:570 start_codon:yes stop_codon:yes gene_type:complete